MSYIPPENRQKTAGTRRVGLYILVIVNLAISFMTALQVIDIRSALMAAQ
ncbi:MAG: hypothetical protein A49_08480 [Methyloceanibacter sp.]|nr:MAG: hypothetical protein A49_08480 [Methyloceanibacter sp.]